MDKYGQSSIQVVYRSGNEGWDISSIVTSISWSGDIKQANRNADLTIRNTRDNKSLMIILEAGEEVLILNNGREIFRGIIFATEIDHDGTQVVNAKDTNFYLTKVTDTKKFVNMTASQIIVSLCKEYGIPYSNIADTGYKIPKLIFQGKTLWEQMTTALTYTTNHNSRKFKINNKSGKLTLQERVKQLNPWVIEDGSNLLSASHSISIENMFTRIKSVKEGKDGKGTITVVVEDKKLIEKYGLMQTYEQISEEKANRSTIRKQAEQLLKEHGKEEIQMSVEALGIDQVIAGTAVYVEQSLTNMLGGYYVTADSHSFDNGVHTMSLTLALTDDLPRIEYEPPTETQNKKASGTKKKKKDSKKKVNGKEVKAMVSGEALANENKVVVSKVTDNLNTNIKEMNEPATDKVTDWYKGFVDKLQG